MSGYPEVRHPVVRHPVVRHPGNDVIFQILSGALGRLVATRPGSSAAGRDQFFTQNGGAFYYEFLPHCMEGGLIEGATPECRGPGQLLLYQRAQEALLTAALPLAREELEARGFAGELGLLKNCRDAEGHIYGAQENYEVEVARGLSLLCYRIGVALLLPLVAVTLLLTLLFIALLLVLTFAAGFAALFLPPLRRRLAWLTEEGDSRRLENALGRFHIWLILVFTWPLVTPFAFLLRGFAFQPIRRQLLAFLITRPVVAGCGSVAGDRRFVLSEKGPAIRQVSRRSILPQDRPIFDSGNLMKMLCAPFNFQLRPVARLFRRRQRLQLGLADSNLAQTAEYLKVGTAALVLDMIEDGVLDDAPRPVDPVAALHAVVADPTLEARIEIRGGGAMTALEIQRFYLRRARRYLGASAATSLEAEEVVRRWGEVLDDLEAGAMDRLVGTLDWVTKRFLLEGSGRDAGEAVLKTLDLRYHELGDGYFARLEGAGEAETLVEETEIRRAVEEPPANTPAFLRGRLIRHQAGGPLPITVSWDSAYVGRVLRGKVLPFRRRR